jgi:uncharacterized protein (TIGR02569 family)
MSDKITLDPQVASAFGIHGKVSLLPGGFDLKTYRSGDIVLRNLGAEGEEAGAWHAELFDKVHENGFRIAKPLKASNGSWVVNGWVAEHFLEGRHATIADMPAIINAAKNFHEALVGVPLPNYRKRNLTMWDRADKWAWSGIPNNIDSQLHELALELQVLKKPVTVNDQLIHGDLNINNILISDTLSPAIIDFTPYFHPTEFALAVTAYWLGPYTGDIEILNKFKNIKEFDQMLIRAGLRSMLTQEDPLHATDLEIYRKANQIIKEFVIS